MTTNERVYGKVIETNLVQRNSENLEKKKKIKENKKIWNAHKRQNFKICKMSLGGTDNIKINL